MGKGAWAAIGSYPSPFCPSGMPTGMPTSSLRVPKGTPNQRARLGSLCPWPSPCLLYLLCMSTSADCHLHSQWPHRYELRLGVATSRRRLVLPWRAGPTGPQNRILPQCPFLPQSPYGCPPVPRQDCHYVNVCANLSVGCRLGGEVGASPKA